MIVGRQTSDELGFLHERYQQKYKGIKVDEAEFVVHSRARNVVRTNGTLVEGLNTDITPTVSVSQALDVALSYLNATVYMWQDSSEENSLKNITGDSSATYFPKTELIITRRANDVPFTAENFVLAYRFDITSKIPDDRNVVYINAQNSEVVKKVPLVYHCVPGSVATLFNGTQTMNTFQRGAPNNDYILLNDCNPDQYHTFDITAGNMDNALEITDIDNTWDPENPPLGNVAEEIYKSGISAHWALEVTRNYYFNTYGRVGWDGDTGSTNCYVHAEGTDYAAWGPTAGSSPASRIRIGKKGPLANYSLVSLDIIGHEFTHGVTHSSAELTLSYESGALNESFSDIFGTAIEYFGGGETADYTIGENMWTADGYLRNMANPNLKSREFDCVSVNDPKQPDTYQGTYWYSGTCDFGGVHINSGVQNFWFYLLSEGGSGTNDKGWQYSVSGITQTKAAKIAYNNLTLYLTSGATYRDALLGSILAAKDLYGVNSTEATQVKNAWIAVGVPALNAPTNLSTDAGTCAKLFSWNASAGATFYRIQVNTQSNFLGTMERDVSNLTQTNYNASSGFLQNRTYYWRVRATGSNGLSDWSTTQSFTTTSCPLDPGGGCPYVEIWDGNSFRKENNILPQSEQPTNAGKDVTDYYMLSTSPVMKDGQYLLQLTEFEHEWSKIDNVTLLAVDHREETQIAVLPTGEIVEYITPFQLQNIDEEFHALTAMDGNPYIVNTQNPLKLQFVEADGSASTFNSIGAGLLLRGWRIFGSSPLKPPSKVVIGGGGMSAGLATTVLFRELPTLLFTPLEQVEQTINIRFLDKIALDYATLAYRVTPNYSKHELNIISAVHLEQGEVVKELNVSDGRYTHLIPGQSIRLYFDTPQQEQGMTRSFILVSHGRYEHYNDTPLPKEYHLVQNYPNPFNPVTRIDYALPENVHVTLQVFDVLGREVASLVDEMQDAGYKRQEWNAETAPNGVDFYKLTTKNFIAVKKMLLSK
ncbi:MAG: M4 family metallopeptidase [Ignavibacteriae bacterium]|nr:M4 family metallopeptidase [Ignavibacteriota bacterium]